MKKNQSGFSIVEVFVVLVILGVIGFIGWKVFSSKNSDKSTDQNQASKAGNKESAKFIWQQTADGWQAATTPPKCPDQPMFKAPADLSKATSVLYPGQTRGNYKPHGGLRFDNATDNAVRVTAPIDGYIVKTARNFAEGTTEVQYNFDIMNNCGVMVRLGHLREIPSSLQEITNKLPPASNDSRIENVTPPVYVKQGDVLATKVGITKNTFFDWGVYDYRQQNEASKSSAYQAAHPRKELDWYAVCWLKDWLPASDTGVLAKLSAGGGENGKTSDYCTQ